MTILVVGATGKTGLPLVEQLLAKDYEVRVLVRSSNRLPAEVLGNPNATVIEASHLELTDEEMAEHVLDCEVVVSCLGHVPSLKGIFGKPRNLCTDATRRLCKAIEENRPPRTTKQVSRACPLCSSWQSVCSGGRSRSGRIPDRDLNGEKTHSGPA